jgi:hypothetical protein
MTAVLDQIAGAELLGRRQDTATNQLLSHALEQLLARSKRFRDTEATSINMQLGMWRDAVYSDDQAAWALQSQEATSTSGRGRVPRRGPGVHAARLSDTVACSAGTAPGAVSCPCAEQRHRTSQKLPGRDSAGCIRPTRRPAHVPGLLPAHQRLCAFRR